MQISQAELHEEITFLINTIKDPEKFDCTLQQLGIVNQASVSISQSGDHKGNLKNYVRIGIELVPTNANCHMVQQIGLSIVYKLQQELPESHRYKIDIFCRPNSHKQAEEVRKQINDKERVRAALENEDIIEFLKRLTE